MGTYEVHWPHSAIGACNTPYQYQSPFYDGVFCNWNDAVAQAVTSDAQNLSMQLVFSRKSLLSSMTRTTTTPTLCVVLSLILTSGQMLPHTPVRPLVQVAITPSAQS